MGVTKNFPATYAGVSLPLRISVRSIATLIGNWRPKTTTASSSRIGASGSQSAGLGRSRTRIDEAVTASAPDGEACSVCDLARPWRNAGWGGYGSSPSYIVIYVVK